MNRRALSAGCALLLGVLLGRYWPSPAREEVQHAVPASEASTPTMHGAPAHAADIVAPKSRGVSPGTVLAVDAATLWPQARRLRHCTMWNRLGRMGALQPTDLEDYTDSDLGSVDALIDGAKAQWDAAPQDQRRALLQRWNQEITSLCAPLGEADEDTLYRSARDAALRGPREARMEFMHNPPLPMLGAARRLDLWGDWADTTQQLLDDMAAQGDPEALFLRGVATGFDARPLQDGIDGLLEFLAPAIDNDPPRAYRDLRAYLASGDTRWAAAAQALLQQVDQRVDAAQRAAIDAEFARR